MKCPKCGYNSFEFQDSCKKCAHDLSDYKATYGLKAIVLPQEARIAMAESCRAETAVADETPETAVTGGDMFSFDLPEEETAAPAATTTEDDNPFNFDEEPAAPQSQEFDVFSFGEEPKSAQAKAEEDAFATLLESSSHDEDAATPPAPEGAGASSIGSSEFDLESFSWDETPETPAAPAETGQDAGTKLDDDLNSLFGDMDDAAKK